VCNVRAASAGAGVNAVGLNVTNMEDDHAKRATAD
jgi:hypothetical protein